MARMFWYTVLLGIVLAVVAGVSWLMAYTTVSDVLGSPPPEMGTQATTFLWDGMPRTPTRPRAWRFAFGPTLIPGAPKVTIFVSPTGQLLRTEPGDLAARVKVMRSRGFN
jgi:hypothetical protein